MKEDLEAVSSGEDSGSTTLRDDASPDGSGVGIEMGAVGGGEAAGGAGSMRSVAVSSVESNTAQVVQDRLNSSKDWWYLKNGDHGQTWGIILKVREKLAEYSAYLIEFSLSLRS